MQVEIRNILGRPGYFVSNEGRIYSNVKGSLRQLTAVRGGPKRAYWYVSLSSNFRTGVHQLVAAMFLPVPESLVGLPLVVRRKDNNPSNNHVENLAWGTQAMNLEDRREAGTMTHGTQNGQAKLTEEQVIEIRRRRIAREKCRDIARDFNIKSQEVNRIGLGQRWKHVAGPVATRQRIRKESKCFA